ncbi:hypothetical protein NPX13_g3825 [Xylaria arbuscula]|uniref:Uncharacterized protein n=1 Tax=Xylaria arbuscula TaxID=114810 RepID=A0A9W8NHI2_9PEZI|nr:hypothetical protein NPX13_g3825 [Xylaria arbuscula]
MKEVPEMDGGGDIGDVDDGFANNSDIDSSDAYGDDSLDQSRPKEPRKCENAKIEQEYERKHEIKQVKLGYMSHLIFANIRTHLI